MSDCLLPERLAYLRPFVDDLLRRDEASIDESIDNTGLLVALKGRVSALSLAAAAEALAGDRAELERWLARQPDHPAGFVAAFLGEPAGLAAFVQTFEPPGNWKPVRARKPRARRLIHMELPPGFTFRREGSGFFLQKGEAVGNRHCVGVGFDRGPSVQELKAFPTGEAAPGFEDVTFGPLSGTRIVRDRKTVTMLLQGGGVKYCIYFEGDSTLVEPYLHTLSVAEGSTP